MAKTDIQAAKKEFTSKEIASYFKQQEGKTWRVGACLSFVADKFKELGATRSSTCCATNYGNSHILNTGIDDIPIGADVFFGNCGGGPCSRCGSRYYGHVGVYVGDGYFVHATGGKVYKTSISRWSNKYRGWGWHGNISVSDLKKPDNPTVYSGSANGTDSVTIKWNGVANTDSYQIYRRKSGAEVYSFVKTISSATTSFTDTGLQSGSKYYYRVYAVNSAGKSDKQGGYEVWTKPDKPKLPTVTQINSSQLRVQWNKVEGASYYILLRRKSGAADYTTVKTLSSSNLSYDDYGLDSGSKYYYKLYAGNSGGRSYRSDSGYGYTKEEASDLKPVIENIEYFGNILTEKDKLPAPSNVKCTANGSTSVTITWDRVNGATGYSILMRKSSDTSYTKIMTSTTECSYKVNGLLPNTKYYFVVRSINKYLQGKSSDSASATTSNGNGTELEMPIVTLKSLDKSSIEVTWKDCKNAKSYRIYRRKSGEDYPTEPTYTTSGLSIKDTGLDSNTLYYYRVYSVDGNGKVSPKPAGIGCYTHPSSPIVKAETVNSQSLKVSWTSVRNANYYTVKIRKLGDSEYKTIADTTGTSYTVSGLLPGTVYYFRVYATIINPSVSYYEQLNSNKEDGVGAKTQ